jgi:hypothetical protein
MEQYCQNPLCENTATNVVAVSVDQPSDQHRSLCAACEEAYSWGVQHGCMTTTPKKLWIAAVTHRGDVVHAEALAGKVKAVKALAEYLKTEEGYDGPADLPDICAWLAEHDERLGIEIFCASVDAGGADMQLSAGTHNPNAQRGLVIDPPPQEKGAEPLYRAVYAIDVNAPNAHQAAERAYQIMIDPQSMRPLLEVIDSHGRRTRIDLSEK